MGLDFEHSIIFIDSFLLAVDNKFKCINKFCMALDVEYYSILYVIETFSLSSYFATASLHCTNIFNM